MFLFFFFSAKCVLIFSLVLNVCLFFFSVKSVLFFLANFLPFCLPIFLKILLNLSRPIGGGGGCDIVSLFMLYMLLLHHCQC